MHPCGRIDWGRRMEGPRRATAGSELPLISRRRFFRSAGGFAALTAATGSAVLDACSSPAEPPGYVGSPSPAMKPQPDGVLRFFTPHEAATLAVLMDQVIPGAARVPSASEAGVVNFVDQRLARDQGVPTFTDPPFARPYAGDRPPGPDTDEVVWVPEDELYRYGVQEVELSSDEVYRRALERIDRSATDLFGAPLVELRAKRQESIYERLTKGRLPAFRGSPSSGLFVDLLASDAAQGWLADPMYGGNRDLSVWKAIGYPGAQRAYTPQEMNTGHTRRPPQSFRQMDPSVAGEAHLGVTLPEAGAEAATVRGPSGDEVEFRCETSLG